MALLPYDMVRCQGNGDTQCADCRRREPGTLYTTNMSPPPAGEPCHYRKGPEFVAVFGADGQLDVAK